LTKTQASIHPHPAFIVVQIVGAALPGSNVNVTIGWEWLINGKVPAVHRLPDGIKGNAGTIFKLSDSFGIIGTYQIHINVRFETTGCRTQVVFRNFQILLQTQHLQAFQFCNGNAFIQIEQVGFGFGLVANANYH